MRKLMIRTQQDNDDVVDAEFEEVDDDKDAKESLISLDVNS